jgi:hypothetical protein
MSSIITNHQILEYQSIFDHYGIGRQSQYKNERNLEMNDDLKTEKENLLEKMRSVLERNENNKKKKINAKSVTNKSKLKTGKHSPTKSKHSRKPDKKVCFNRQ